jgi:SAM-dependent methyltransferase
VKNSSNLTEQAFWDDFWENIQIPVTPDHHFSFDRCLTNGLCQFINNSSEMLKNTTVRSTVLEIGAAPGKWLSIFPQDSYQVSGIEYCDKGMQALQANLQALGIEPGKLYHADFFTLLPEPSYDIVMSLGFIEHFKDPLLVIKRHIEWLKPGGLLILGVPNFTGLHGFAQFLLDKKILDVHNTSIMNRSFFYSLHNDLGIELNSFQYLGSFEPNLPMTYQRRNLVNLAPKIILKLAAIVRRASLWDRINSSFTSSYILASYTKGDLN